MSDLMLLPPNATPFERALDQTANRLVDISTAPIRDVKDPAQVPVAFLPFLAWERGVDLWYDDWPDWKKRRITAESYRLKGLKGTLSGIGAYLFYVDAEIADFVVPPQGIVARRQDPERLAQFRARFAQLRVYPFRRRGQRPGAAAGRVSAVAGRCVAAANKAPQHYGRRAVIFDKGIETQIRSQDQLRIDTDEASIAATTFAIPGVARGNEALVGKSAAGSVVARSTQRGRMFVVGATGLSAGAAIPPGGSSVRALNIDPETVYERHDGLSYTPVNGRRPRMAVGRMVARYTRAVSYIYARWYLFDPARADFDPYRAVGPVVGRAIAGLSPFRAHLRVNARFAPGGRKSVVGKISVGKAVAGHASDRIDRVGRAIFRAKALRDTVRFTTRTYRAPEIGDLDFSQDMMWGEMVPITRRQA